MTQIERAGSSPLIVDDSRFLNRELTWLEFNRRVLHEALDDRTPLLERVQFLSIFNSNLDEFFQKRVGGLKRQVVAGVTSPSPDGLSPRQQLAEIRGMVIEQLQVQADCFDQQIRPALAEHDIHMVTWEDLSADDVQYARSYFRRYLFPTLTPLAVDPGHPFPFISNLSMSLAVMLRQPEDVPSTFETEEFGQGRQFARVKVPRMLPRWIDLPVPGERWEPGADSANAMGPPFRFIHVLEVIRHNLADLFEGMIVEEVMPFRITRNAAVEQDDDDAEDLLDLVEQELRVRRFANVIRLEVPAQPNPEITRLLIEELEIEEHDVYLMPSELDYTDLKPIVKLDMPSVKFNPWTPITPPRLIDSHADIFSVMRQGDLMVHHPYESFGASVERFIRAAASDPKVVAIKLTLYRTSDDSPFIPELIRAAELGKQVVCLVELKARFDEERNIQMAQKLEKAGIHVVYGIVGLKTHTKTAMVVRHEAEGMRVYAHVGTGNYNSVTANLYTDLGLFTCDTRITDDLVELFHFLTGRSIKRDFQRLLIAPINMRRRFSEMIDREISHVPAWQQRGGDPDDPDRPRIIAKMNSLEDQKICQRLYRASQAGVKIDLIVRGFCCIRPGVPGLSDNITVTSVIGRFLEHSRIFCFHNAGRSEYYIGSADWMYRNLNNRVECITPIYDPALQRRLRTILEIMLADRRQAWDMHPDGSYTQRQPDEDSPDTALGSHRALMEQAVRDASWLLQK